MAWCDHPNMQSTARTDYCPDCKYEFYYGDAHGSGGATESKVVNSGRDAQANGVRIPTFDLLPYEDESAPPDRYSWEQW